MLSGAEFVYVGMPVATYAFSLYAGPEIKEVTDLRGKVLGVITKGASFDHTAIALLRQYKMTQQDMKGLYFSRQEDAPAALIHGIVQAGGAFDADYVDGAPLGLQGIGHIGALKLPYPFMGLAVRRSAILQSPDVVRGFLQAMVAGLRLSIEQPNVSKRAIGKYLASKDQEIIDEVYGSFAQ
jgi:ABC-type nitrate/sulfonate/bicarbonate transport system substrate-binding protein